MALQHRFHDLLVRAAAELHEHHRDRMRRPDLIPTLNAIGARWPWHRQLALACLRRARPSRSTVAGLDDHQAPVRRS